MCHLCSSVSVFQDAESDDKRQSRGSVVSRSSPEDYKEKRKHGIAKMKFFLLSDGTQTGHLRITPQSKSTDASDMVKKV